MTHEEWKDKIEATLRNAEDNTLIDIYNNVYSEARLGYYGNACQYICESYCDPDICFERLAELYENNVPYSGNFFKDDGIHIELDIADDLTDLIDDFDFHHMTDEIMKDPFKYIRISTDDEFNKLISDYMNDVYIEEE